MTTLSEGSRARLSNNARSLSRCRVARYTFPGFFGFLKDAALQIGHPEAEGPARKVLALAALANLCAQAGEADSGNVEGIMAKAEEFRDQLHAAYAAAELILIEVNTALGLPVQASQAERPSRSIRPRRQS